MFPIGAIDQNISKKESFMNNATEHTLSKVPEVTLIFWIIKIAATTLGETGGDAVSMSMNLGYLVGTAIFAAVFLIAVVAQIKAKHFHPFLYWTTIIATTTVGTTLADFADRSLGIGYSGGASLLFVLLMASLAIWYKSLGSVSVDTVSSPKEEMFYWITIMFSQTLGTALGDWTADTAGLGDVYKRQTNSSIPANPSSETSCRPSNIAICGVPNNFAVPCCKKRKPMMMRSMPKIRGVQTLQVESDKILSLIHI